MWCLSEKHIFLNNWTIHNFMEKLIFVNKVGNFTYNIFGIIAEILYSVDEN